MTRDEVIAYWKLHKEALHDNVFSVENLHPYFCDEDFNSNAGYSVWTVKPKLQDKAEYHGRYGLPADPDLVWEDRHKEQANAN